MQQVLQRGGAATQRAKTSARNASWDDLKSLLACADHRSFRRAAECLGLTNTTLMRRIDRLEQRVGCKLFLRDQRGLTLSEEGAAVLRDIREMERHALNVFRRVSTAHEAAGVVRVAATEGPGSFWILPRLMDFQQSYREITIDLRCVLEPANVARLESDIAVQLEPPTNPDLIVVKLGRLHIYPFVSRDYARLHGVPNSLSELKQHRIVRQEAPQLDNAAYARVLGLPLEEGSVGIKTNSSIGALYAVERGAGVGFLPSAAAALGAPLVPVDIGVNHSSDLWLTYHKEFRSSARHKIVVDWLRKIFDARTYACFRDEFIHPNELTSMMAQARTCFGLEGFMAAPAS